MIVKDSRSPVDLLTHHFLVTGIDRVMSYTGAARGGKSRVAWVCRKNDLDTVCAWVKARGDITYVRTAGSKGFRPKDCAHFHFYVVRDGHPALG